jgi:Ca2+-binding RTX toxin-like protein
MPSNPKLRLALALLAPLLACAQAPGPDLAPEGAVEVTHQPLQTTLTSPYGAAPVDIYVGRWYQDGDHQHYVVFRRKSDWSCQWYLVGGTNNIDQDLNILSGPGDDYIDVVRYGGRDSFQCWYRFIQSAVTYYFDPAFHDGSTITVLGGAGMDQLDCGGFRGPVICRGELGNDLLISRQYQAELYGGAGNDTLFGTAFGTVLQGGDNDDCVQFGDGNIGDGVDCGANDPSTYGDKVAPSSLHTLNCEVVVDTCASKIFPL